MSIKIQSPSSAASSMPNIAVISGANDANDVSEIRSLTSALMQQTSDAPIVPEVARERIRQSAEEIVVLDAKYLHGV